MDALLAKPGAYIRDPVLWQWQDDKGNWHTYGYNDCRVIEAAHVAGKTILFVAFLATFCQSMQWQDYKGNWHNVCFIEIRTKHSIGLLLLFCQKVGGNCPPPLHLRPCTSLYPCEKNYPYFKICFLIGIAVQSWNYF